MSISFIASFNTSSMIDGRISRFIYFLKQFFCLLSFSFASISHVKWLDYLYTFSYMYIKVIFSFSLIILMIILKRKWMCTGGWQEDKDWFLIKHRSEMPFDSTLYVSVFLSYRRFFFCLWKDGDMTPPYFYVQTICLVIVLKFQWVKEEESRWLHHSTLINLWREDKRIKFKHELTWDKYKQNESIQSNDSSLIALLTN
jgi:hypothetical protein